MDRKPRKEKNRTEVDAFIYSLSDPRDGVVRYVGETTTSIHLRLGYHITTAFSTSVEYPNHSLASWIREMVMAGVLPKIEVLENFRGTKFDRLKREEYWTWQFDNLFNVSKEDCTLRLRKAHADWVAKQTPGEHSKRMKLWASQKRIKKLRSFDRHSWMEMVLNGCEA